MRDALLVILSALFVLCGLVAVAVGNLRLGLPTILMFGAAFALFSRQMLARQRTRRALDSPATLQGIGGLRILAPRARKLWIACALLAIGVAFAWGFAPRGWWPAALGWLIAGFGVAVGGFTLVTAPPWMLLRPEGIEFGSAKAVYIVPWDDIIGVQLGEFNRHTMIFLTLRDLRGTIASVQPPGQAAAFGRAMADSQAMMGFPLVILPDAFELEPAWLLRALTDYVTEPARRAELVVLGQLPGPVSAGLPPPRPPGSPAA